MQPYDPTSFPRIALKCPACGRVLAETDGYTRLYFGDEAYIEREMGRITIHCQCGARAGRVHWAPRAAVEIEQRIVYTVEA